MKGSGEEKYQPIAICCLLLEIIPGAKMVYLQELRNWAFLWELHFDSALNSLGLKWAITAKTKTSEGACPNQGVLIHKRLTVSVSGAENWGSHDCHPQESCPFPATLELPKPSSWQSRGPPALLQAFSLARARLNGSWETGPSLVVLIVRCQGRRTRDVGWIHGLGRSPGGGNGNALQYSCLEKPMDRGAWWATVHRVTQSQIQLKPLSRCAH